MKNGSPVGNWENIPDQHQVILNIHSTDNLVGGVMNQRWCLMATKLKGE